MKGLKKISFTMLAVAAISCKDSNFQGQGTPRRQPITYSIITPGIESVQGDSKTMFRGDILNISFAAGGVKSLGQNTQTQITPVDLVFVVDTSSSMTNQINAVKTSINDLVSKLKAAGIDLWVGFIGFCDTDASLQGQVSSPLLTNNISSFQTFMNTIRAGGSQNDGNTDSPEAGLYAIRYATSQLASAGRPNAIKSIVYVSDVVAHNGGSGPSTPDQPRDCSINYAVQSIAQLNNSLGTMDRFKFFYSVATTGASQGAYRCNNTAGTKQTAREQMQSLMGSILNGVSYKGGELVTSSGAPAWPLSGSTLVESILPALSKTIVLGPNQGVCLAQSAQLFDMSINPNQPISQWQSQGLAHSYQMFGANNQIPLSQVFPNSASLSQGVHQLQLRTQRCCVEYSAIQSGQIASAQCKQSFMQTVDYTIQVK